MAQPLIVCTNLSRSYNLDDGIVTALHPTSLKINAGDFVAITGQSGSGKSTLMHLLGCLDSPTSGTYVLHGINVSHYSPGQLALIRNQHIGFIFQRFNLLPTLTAFENIALPLRYAGVAAGRITNTVSTLLSQVDLKHRADHYPHQLSGGQQQRIAIARALAIKPKLLLADEPTGNLDSETGEIIMQMLEKIHRENKTTILLVTHEAAIANRAQRIIRLRDGRILD